MQRLSLAVRERLGEEAARDLEDYVAGVGTQWSDEMTQTSAERFDNRLAMTAECFDHQLAATTERFDNRLATVAADLRLEMAGMRSDLHNEMHQGFERIWQAIADLRVSLRQEIADARVEVLRWSFLFWVGEVALLVSVLAFMLRGVASR